MNQRFHVNANIGVDAVLSEICAEVLRAEEKFPDWPDDLIHGAAIMAEESGEAVKAALNCVYRDAPRMAYRKELVQTAAWRHSENIR